MRKGLDLSSVSLTTVSHLRQCLTNSRSSVTTYGMNEFEMQGEEKF